MQTPPLSVRTFVSLLSYQLNNTHFKFYKVDHLIHILPSFLYQRRLYPKLFAHSFIFLMSRLQIKPQCFKSLYRSFSLTHNDKCGSYISTKEQDKNIERYSQKPKLLRNQVVKRPQIILSEGQKKFTKASYPSGSSQEAKALQNLQQCKDKIKRIANQIDRQNENRYVLEKQFLSLSQIECQAYKRKDIQKANKVQEEIKQFKKKVQKQQKKAQELQEKLKQLEKQQLQLQKQYDRFKKFPKILNK